MTFIIIENKSLTYYLSRFLLITLTNERSMSLMTLVLFIPLIFAAVIKDISPQDAKTLFDNKKAIIIDVREPNETASGVVTGAKLLPMSVMQNQYSQFKNEIDKLPRDKTIIVYCAAGRRAQLVGLEIQKLGHKVLSLGNYSKWVEAGFPVSK